MCHIGMFWVIQCYFLAFLSNLGVLKPAILKSSQVTGSQILARSNCWLTNLVKSNLESSHGLRDLVKSSLMSSHNLTDLLRSSLKSSHRLANLVKSSQAKLSHQA